MCTINAIMNTGKNQKCIFKAVDCEQHPGGKKCFNNASTYMCIDVSAIGVKSAKDYMYFSLILL